MRKAACEDGSSVILNGSNGSARRMVCSYCFRQYQNPRKAKDSTPYRKESLINGEKNGRRENGLKCSKKHQLVYL